MTTVTIKDAKNRLSELARLVEQGETVTVTRHGKPAFDLVPHRRKGGINFAALEAYKKKHGIDQIVTYVAPDFDDPLPEDFLLRPLPRMKLSLDTNVILAMLRSGNIGLSVQFLLAINSDQTESSVSVASVWEIAIKFRLGKLQLGIALLDLPKTIEELGIALLTIDHRHALAEVRPQPPTRDPFDRLLLAQCAVEDMRLMTTDSALAAHPLAWHP